MSVFEGAGVALVTPMKDNGEVNYEKLEEIVAMQVNGGTDSHYRYAVLQAKHLHLLMRNILNVLRQLLILLRSVFL